MVRCTSSRSATSCTVIPPGAAATISSARIPRSRVCDPAFFDGAGAAASAGTASRSVISAHFARGARLLTVEAPADGRIRRLILHCQPR